MWFFINGLVCCAWFLVWEESGLVGVIKDSLFFFSMYLEFWSRFWRGGRRRGDVVFIFGDLELEYSGFFGSFIW